MCGICGKLGRAGLCRKCEIKLKRDIHPNVDDYREDNSKYFDKHIYFSKYDGIIREKIIRYKFRNKAYLYETFVKLLINNCDFLNLYDIMIPVPIHRLRRNERGYNQSELIAKELCAGIENIRYEDKILQKIKNIVPQSSLNKQEREQNIRNVYLLKDSDKVNGKNIIVFDDIYTTGSTVNEISKLLRQNGAKEITILTIAKD